MIALAAALAVVAPAPAAAAVVPAGRSASVRCAKRRLAVQRRRGDRWRIAPGRCTRRRPAPPPRTARTPLLPPPITSAPGPAPATATPGPAVPGSPVPGPAPDPTPALPSRTSVTLYESMDPPPFRLSTPYTTFAAGRVELNVANRGEDDHNLFVEDGEGRVVAFTPTLGPGDERQLTPTLAAGSYTLLCTIADHAANGMRRTITVR